MSEVSRPIEPIPPLRVFDTHVHVVSPDTERFPQTATPLANGAWWHTAPDDVSAIGLSRGLAEARSFGVALVQAAGAYGADNRYLLEALKTPNNFVGSEVVGVAIVDPTTSPAEVTDNLVELVGAGIRGLRVFHIPTPDTPWLGSPVGDRLIDTAADLGLSISVCIQDHDLELLGHQLQRRPDVTLLLDHCGFVDLSDPASGSAARLWELSKHDQLVVKVTPTLLAMAAESAAGGSSADQLNQAWSKQELLGEVVRRFGADRVVLATDWPQHREIDENGRHLTYAETIEAVISWTEPFPVDDRRAMLSDNGLRFYGLEPTAADATA